MADIVSLQGRRDANTYRQREKLQDRIKYLAQALQSAAEELTGSEWRIDAQIEDSYILIINRSSRKREPLS